jgi:DNA-binding XRE family transcriptional regulator
VYRNRIKELREGFKFGRGDLAHHIGETLNIELIERIEAGEILPRLDQINALAELFDMTPEDLYSIEVIRGLTDRVVIPFGRKV